MEEVLKTIARAEITSPPGFGAKIVATIVKTPDLREQWQRDMKTISGRLRNIRKRLYDELTKRGTPGNWGHFVTDVSISRPYSRERRNLLTVGLDIQTGMFSMTGLAPEKVAVLRERFHIYLMPTGRLAFTGCKELQEMMLIHSSLIPANIYQVTESAVEYVAESIHRVVTA